MMDILYKIILSFFLLNISVFAQVNILDITSTNLIDDSDNEGRFGGHGIQFADCDGDGDPDLYITMNNGNPVSDQFFENNNGVFTEKAVERGIDDFDSRGSHGWVWADLDNDGDFDGWNGSFTENIVYKNINNNPGFYNNVFSTSGIEDLNLGSRGIVAFDFDNDGDLDLFANNWYANNQMQENEFYRNNGDFTFTRIENGLKNAGGDQGVCDGDFDNDGDIDLILSVFDGDKDGRCVKIMENINGQFIELENSGLTLCNSTIDGVTFWDMNNDGWLDVISGEKIFLNNHDKTFTELLNVPAGTNRFMRGIADLNNDGYWDLVSPGDDKIYINNGNLTFSSISFDPGTINDPRCVSFADIDNDGDVDFALGQKATYNKLYRNDYDGENNYLFVKLISPEGQRGAFGAKVYIYSEDGQTLLNYRHAHSNQGYLSQDDPVLHFGCGDREKVKVKIIFLNGETVEFICNTNKTTIYNVENRYIAYNHGILELPQTAGLDSLIIVSNGSWSISENLDWLSLSQINGNNDQRIKLLYENNTYNESRSGYLDITFGEQISKIKINQAGSVPLLEIEQDSIHFSFDSTNSIINLQSNDYWEITQIPEWVKADPDSGFGNTTVNLSCLSNIDSLNRSSVIVFRNGKIIKHLNLLQEGLPVYTVTTLLDSSQAGEITGYGRYLKNTKVTLSVTTNPGWKFVNFTENDSIISKDSLYTFTVLSDRNFKVNFIKITTGIKDESLYPNEFKLFQNYPNPFNPITTIKYSIPPNVRGEIPRVILAIYDILGRKILTPINTKQQNGTYEVIIDGSKLSSGIYYYRLTYDGFILTKKMTLMK